MLKLVWAIVCITASFLHDAKTGYLLVEIEDSKEVPSPPTLPNPTPG